MPKWIIHRKVAKLLGFKPDKNIDLILDLFAFTHGKNHRKYLHDFKIPILIYLLTNDKNKAYYALLHILLDKLFKYEDSKKLELFLRFFFNKR